MGSGVRAGDHHLSRDGPAHDDHRSILADKPIQKTPSFDVTKGTSLADIPHWRAVYIVVVPTITEQVLRIHTRCLGTATQRTS